jgi:hypothetical protein
VSFALFFLQFSPYYTLKLGFDDLATKQLKTEHKPQITESIKKQLQIRIKKQKFTKKTIKKTLRNQENRPEINRNHTRNQQKSKIKKHPTKRD